MNTHHLHTLPYLGNGIGYRSELASFIYLNQPKINFVEIIAEHFMDVPPARMQELERLQKYFTVIPHAINLSLGSTEGIDKNYLKKLAALIHQIQPPYWSEHISYTQAHGYDVGHLAPIIYNQALLDLMQKNIEEVQRYMKIPLILENITYHVEMPGRQYSDAEFLNTLCQKTGCGLLLDITNLYINSVNFGFNPYDFIRSLNLKNVVQLHYVGFENLSSGLLIDTHGKETQAELFELMEFILQKHLPGGVLLERDKSFEKHEEITSDITRTQQLLEKYRHASE